MGRASRFDARASAINRCEWRTGGATLRWLWAKRLADGCERRAAGHAFQSRHDARGGTGEESRESNGPGRGVMSASY